MDQLNRNLEKIPHGGHLFSTHVKFSSFVPTKSYRSEGYTVHLMLLITRVLPLPTSTSTLCVRIIVRTLVSFSVTSSRSHPNERNVLTIRNIKLSTMPYPIEPSNINISYQICVLLNNQKYKLHKYLGSIALSWLSYRNVNYQHA